MSHVKSQLFEKLSALSSMRTGPAPFIVGAPRSGTTLLRMMLDAHPEIAIPPETGFLLDILEQQSGSIMTWEDLFKDITQFETWIDFHLSSEALADRLRRLDPFCVPDGLRCFYKLYAERFAKSGWGDKTPNYGLRLQAIGALLPEARFLHLIRDGRDVAASIRDLWFAPSRDFGQLATDWSWRVRTIRSQGAHYPFYLEIRYEQLITDTEAVLRRICSFLEIDFSNQMLDYYRFSPARLQEHESRIRPDGTVVIRKEDRHAMQRLTTRPPDRSRCGAWRRVMSIAEHESFVRAAGSLLRELDYL
jgi:hypothetical protein